MFKLANFFVLSNTQGCLESGDRINLVATCTDDWLLFILLFNYSTALVSEFGSIIEMVNDSEPLPVYSRDVTASPACFQLPDSSERSVSSLSLHTEQDMLSTAGEPVSDACLGERVLRKGRSKYWILRIPKNSYLQPLATIIACGHHKRMK